MAPRQRRRRRAAPGRRLRRWYRRQGRLTRLLLPAAFLIGALLVWVTLQPEGGGAPERRVARPPAGPRATSPPALPRATVGAKPARARRDAPAPAPPAEQAAPSRGHAERDAAPRAAIVIDDLGQRLSHLEVLAGLGMPLTIAVIPNLPATAATVREASRLGIEMLLHQPMEPREEGGNDPGTGVLLTTMSGDEVRARLREGLAAVPGAVGVNNHMGSRFTEDPGGLAVLMAELKGRGLFWLDSRTSAATRGAEAARLAGVPALERDVFLDAEASTAFVRRQLRRLVKTARARGSAVGIGHPYPETIAALRELRGELLASGVSLVPLSALVPPAAGGGTAIAAAAGGDGKSRPAQAAAAGSP